MASKDDYIHFAAECIALAQRATNQNDKARLLQMAQAWRDLADKQDAQPKKSGIPSS